MGRYRGKRKKSPVMCNYKDRKYYFPQLDRCDRCDKCLPGEGYPQDEPSSMIMFNKDHGALSCLPCVPCPMGYFNNKRGYKCRPCRDCTKQGRLTASPCTATFNAQCGDVLPTTPVFTQRRESAFDVRSSPRTPETQALHQNSPATVGLESPSATPSHPVNANSIAMFSVLFLLVLITIAGTLYYYYRRRKLRSKDPCPIYFVNNKVQKNNKNLERSKLLTKRSNPVAASERGERCDKISQTTENSTTDTEETRVKLSSPRNNRSSTSSQTTEKTQLVSMPTTTSSLPASSHSENQRNHEHSSNVFPKLSIFDPSMDNCDQQRCNHAWEEKYKSIGYKDFHYLNSIPTQNPEGLSPESMKDLSEFSFYLGSRSPTVEIP